MFKITSASKNTMLNGKFILSASQILRSLKELGLDPSFSEMLFTTQQRSVNARYKEESTKLLVAFSTPPSATFRSVIRRDRKHYEALIRARYDATLTRKTTAVKIPMSSSWDAVETQAQLAIMPLIKYEIIS
ncbi:MAG: hypothetical protein ACRC6V_03505 [Bacteroidales bacterium]